MGARLYEIVVRGSVGSSIANALPGFDVVRADHGETRFVGWACDGCALRGALDEVFRLGLDLRSVRLLEDPAPGN